MSADESSAAAGAGLAGASVDRQSLDEAASPAGRVAVVANPRAAVRDRFLEHLDDGSSECRCLIGCHRLRGARRVDASAPERLVRVDVSYPHGGTLVHQHLLDCLSTAPKKDR